MELKRIIRIVIIIIIGCSLGYIAMQRYIKKSMDNVKIQKTCPNGYFLCRAACCKKGGTK